VVKAYTVLLEYLMAPKKGDSGRMGVYERRFYSCTVKICTLSQIFPSASCTHWEMLISLIPKVSVELVILRYDAKVDAAWLRRAAAPDLYRYDDEGILRDIAARMLGHKTPPTLEPSIFEATLGLTPLLNCALGKEQINDPLAYKKSSAARYKNPDGDTLLEQITSLLPEETGNFPQDNQVLEAFAYAMSRIVIGDLPPSHKWQGFYSGLDYLTSALFTIQMVAVRAGTPISWIDIVRGEAKDAGHLTEWQTLTLRADGATASKWTGFLNRFRSRVCALNSDYVRKITLHLAEAQEPVRITMQLVQKLLSSGGKVARRVTREMDTLLTERFIPSMTGIGLRQRVIATPGRRSEVPTKGAAEKYACKDTTFSSSEFLEIVVYAEPASSVGPHEEDLIAGSVQVTADSEIISMRTDLFGNESGEPKWSVRPWQAEDMIPKDTPGWLYCESPQVDGAPWPISQRDRDLLGILCAHHGGFQDRLKLVRAMGIPNQSAKERVETLLARSFLTVLYHPSLEYSAIPEGVYIIIHDSNPKNVEAIWSYLLKGAPYVRSLRTEGGRGLFAIIRVPALQSTIFLGPAREYMNGLGVNYITGLIDKQKTYRMTLLHRLHSEKGWRDPWRLTE